jgi:hypothetical protein
MLYTIKIEDQAGNKIETTRHFSTRASANEAIKQLTKLFKGHTINVVSKSDKDLLHTPIIVDKVIFDDPERENKAVETVVNILKAEGQPTLKSWLRLQLEKSKIPKKDIDKVLAMKSPYWRVEKRAKYNASYYVLTRRD